MKHDRENNMQEQDYRDAFAPREVDVEAKTESKIPELKSSISKPNADYKPMPLVSVSVNQTVPLRDVLYEIAEQANYDIELDPRITGSIIFSARNRPMDDVIDRIADIAGLRYSFNDDMLRVEIDTPYHETYKINYLTLKRTNSSSISSDISVVSGEGTDTGSSFSASNESVIDFWTELDENLTQILNSNRDSGRLATTADPSVTVAENNPAPISPIVMDENGNISENGPDVQVQAPDAVLNVNSLPPVDSEGSSGDDDPFSARFSLNKQAGLISVFAPERTHKKVSAYLKSLQKSVTSQVLIEAKVLEVSLNDRFSAGIDWSQLDVNLFGGTGALGFGPSQSPGFAGGLVRGLIGDSGADTGYNAAATFTRGDFGAAVDALSRFGTVQALASPRLTVLNNQSAALNVAENVVYFEITQDITPGTDGGQPIVSTDVEIKTVPEGVLINVQPSIDNDTQKVSMAIRPTITKITRFVDDPINGDNQVPQVNIQEFDSIIQMNNGQAVVLGGLIQDRVESTRNGVPVVSEVPFIGGLFRNQQDAIKKTELVVFLKATIIDNGDNIHNTDKDLYRTFSSDRRPFEM